MCRPKRLYHMTVLGAVLAIPVITWFVVASEVFGSCPDTGPNTVLCVPRQPCEGRSQNGCSANNGKYAETQDFETSYSKGQAAYKFGSPLRCWTERECYYDEDFGCLAEEGEPFRYEDRQTYRSQAC